jgi:hypothetical protein
MFVKYALIEEAEIIAKEIKKKNLLEGEKNIC